MFSRSLPALGLGHTRTGSQRWKSFRKVQRALLQTSILETGWSVGGDWSSRAEGQGVLRDFSLNGSSEKKKKQPVIFTWTNSLKCEVWPTVAQRPQVWIDGWCCWFLNISVASFHFFFTGSCNKSHGETWLPQDHSCCHWCSVKPLLSLKGSL